jgi:hypothetical protein
MAGVPTADGKGFYLLSLNRTRVDPPTGMVGGVLKGGRCGTASRPA